MDEVGFAVVAARVAALTHLDALPDEPTLAQASVVRPQVAAVLALPVVPALAAGIDAVMRIPLSEKEAWALVAATTRLAGYAAAAQTTVLADLTSARDERVAREVLEGDADRWAMRSGASSVGAEVAPILKVADRTAIGTVSRACYTAAHLPIALDAVAGGVMTQGQAGCPDRRRPRRRRAPDRPARSQGGHPRAAVDDGSAAHRAGVPGAPAGP